MLAEHAGRVALTSPRIRTAAVLLVLALGAIVAALLIRNPQPAGVTHHDPRLDISVRVPEGWHTQSFDDRVGFATHTGFIVSNVPHHFRHPLGEATSAWDMSELPANAVVVDVSRVVAGLDVGPCNAERGGVSATDFPISLDRFRTITGASRFGGPPRRYLRVCLEDGSDFGVHAWLFPQASERDRNLAAELISSITPS